jgi:tetratricopeptide (TPR) repeat protein
MLEATGYWLSQGGQSPARWRGLLETLQVQPDGLSALIWRYLRSAMHFSVGLELAMHGDAGMLEHVQVLAEQQRTQPQACSLRLLYALAYGDHKTAASERRQRAIAALASAHEDQQLTYSYITEVVLLEACGDLLELQPLAAWFEARAEQLQGVRPVAAYVRAACHLLSGQIAQAEQLIDAHMSLAPPLGHALWFMLRAQRAELALLRGEPDLARQLAQAALDTAERAGADIRPDTRAQRTLALAHAQLGDVESALSVLEPLLQGLGSTVTVQAGQLHETRARVALLADDREGFWLHYSRVQGIYGRFAYPPLTARLQRLTSSAIQTQHARGLSSLSAQQKLTTIRTDLERLEGEEQCRYVLAMLLRDAEAHSGYLYGVRAHGPSRCLANLNAEPTDPALDAQVTVYFERLTQADNERTQSVMLDAEWSITRRSVDGRSERLAVIPLRGSEGTLRGLALLRTISEASAEVRTEGLCTIAADVLAQLTASRRAMA